MNATHTPGPWHVNALDYQETGTPPTGRYLQIVGDASVTHAAKYAIVSPGGYVCTVDRSSTSAQCDARLIAAAPELLAALEELLAESLSMNADLRRIGKGRPEDGAHPDCAIEQVRAAIARAKDTP